MICTFALRWRKTSLFYLFKRNINIMNGSKFFVDKCNDKMLHFSCRKRKLCDGTVMVLAASVYSVERRNKTFTVEKSCKFYISRRKFPINPNVIRCSTCIRWMLFDYGKAFFVISTNCNVFWRDWAKVPLLLYYDTISLWNKDPIFFSWTVFGCFIFNYGKFLNYNRRQEFSRNIEFSILL